VCITNCKIRTHDQDQSENYIGLHSSHHFFSLGVWLCSIKTRCFIKI